MNGIRREPTLFLVFLLWLILTGSGCSGDSETAATAQAVVEQVIASETPSPTSTLPPTATSSPVPPTATARPPTTTPIPPSPTSEPAPATPLPPTPSATPNIFVNISDQLGDTVDCQTQALVADSEVDLQTVQAWGQGDLLWIRVLMATPLTKDYSFAVLLGIESGDNAAAYIWEIHEEVVRSGELELQTGDVNPGTPIDLNVQHNTDSGEIHYSMNLTSTVQSGVNSLQIATFHTSAPDEATICDSLGPLTFTVPP